MNSPVLYILTGLPYAGKSTLRNELVKRFGFAVVSIDDINMEYGIGIDESKPIIQKDWDTSYTEAYERLKKYFHEGKSVIFDGGSLLFSEREMQRQIAKRYSTTSKLIYVNTPIEEIKERWARNQKTKERGHVPENLFRAALKMWEEPTATENPILYNNSMDLDRWIEDTSISR